MEHDPTHPQGALAKPLHLGRLLAKSALGAGWAEGALAKAPWPNPPPGAFVPNKPRQGALGLGNSVNRINNTGV